MGTQRKQFREMFLDELIDEMVGFEYVVSWTDADNRLVCRDKDGNAVTVDGNDLDKTDALAWLLEGRKDVDLLEDAKSLAKLDGAPAGSYVEVRIGRGRA